MGKTQFRVQCAKKNICRVIVSDKYLHWPRVSVRKNIYTLKHDKCKCKSFGRVSVNCIYDYGHLHTQHWYKVTKYSHYRIMEARYVCKDKKLSGWHRQPHNHISFCG